MNKGLESGVRKYNTTNNDPSKSVIIDKSIGGVLKFFLSSSSIAEERASNTTDYPVSIRSSPNLYSTVNNNQTWTGRNAQFGTSFGTNNDIYSIAYGNNVWVAVGEDGKIRSSTDTVTWTTRTSNITAVGLSVIRAVAFGNNLWVAAGDGGAIRTSTDAITWTTQTSNITTVGASSINSVAFGNNLFVAGANGGNMRTSTDGVTWNTTTSNFGVSNISVVSYLNNLWLAGGNGSVLRTSTDAVTWTTQSISGLSNFEGIAYGQNIWMAAGWDGTGGVIRASTDAVTWTTRPYPAQATILYSIGYGNNMWIVGDQYGSIRTSTDSVNWVEQRVDMGINGTINSIVFENDIWAASANGDSLIFFHTPSGTDFSPVVTPLQLNNNSRDNVIVGRFN